MKFFPLIWAAVWRKPVRGILTLLSVTVAFMLFGMVIGFKASFDHVQDLARADRILINPRFGGDLPFAMNAELAQIPGVTHVATLGFVFGYNQTPRNNAFVITVDNNMRSVWPELPVTEAQYGELAANPTGAFFSRLAAQKYHVEPGDNFPVKAPSIRRADGGQTWTFKVLGLVDDVQVQPNGFILGNINYFNEARIPALRNKGAFFRVLIADPAQGDAMVKLIDKHFANSGTPIRSITEKSAYDTANSGIDIPFITEAIAGAGLFMILFLTGNSIAQSVRERIPEFAVLKTIGFSDGGVMALVFAEATIPCLFGAVIGIGLAAWFGAIFPSLVPPGFGIPPPYLPPAMLGVALICAALVAVLSAVIPATRISRLDVATALSGR